MMTRDVESQPSDQNHTNTNTQSPEEAYRQRCRTFYRQSTSIIEDDDEDDNKDDADDNKNPPPKDNRVVLEAVDCLILQQQQQQQHNSSVDEDAYVIFWYSLSAKQRDVLEQCGLPTAVSSSSTKRTESLSLEQLVTIRTEERQLAHQVTMQERLEVLHSIWNELLLTQQQQLQLQQHGTTTSTTRHQVLLIQQTLRQFVHDYHSSSVACHSLLAGMRHCLERQLDQAQHVCVMWTLDAAVITEAMVAKPQGGSSRYLRHALQALLSFLVGLPTTATCSKTSDINNNNNIQRVLQLVVNPSWSDRTLTHILQVLPRPHELQARPTGTFQVPLPQPIDDGDNDILTTPLRMTTTTTTTTTTPPQIIVRTNVEGESDEPMDMCLALVKHLTSKGWWFC
jgi:hypothetical protein